MRVTGSYEGANQKHQDLKEVTLKLYGTKTVIKHKIGLLSLTEALDNVSKRT